VAWLWWFSRWVQVREWQQQIIARARKEGYTRTLMGRYRELPLINSPNAAARGHAARAAINTPIQGAVGVFFLLKVDAHPPPLTSIGPSAPFACLMTLAVGHVGATDVYTPPTPTQRTFATFPGVGNACVYVLCICLCLCVCRCRCMCVSVSMSMSVSV
jgi:hypothetical protein